MPTVSRGNWRGPSIQDVARVAGVSAQTVSRVSTGSPAVRETTRARVLQAMEQLGYSPNDAARALRSGSFGTIGILSHRFERTGEAMITAAVQEAAIAQEMSVTLLRVRESEAPQWNTAAHRISHQSIDGLIIIRTEMTSPESLALPAGLRVAASDSVFHGHYPSVLSNPTQGSIDATELLLNMGHSTVYHLAGPADSPAALAREGAWRSTLERAGIRPPRVWRGDWSPISGYEVGREIARDPAVTAVFSANDEMAFGLLRALYEAGRTVPDDISVIGFDDIALASVAHVPLTTVKQDFRTMGTELVRIVLTPPHEQDEVERKVIPTPLVMRASAAPPRPR